ncbi:hypothetical protein R1flu_006253 [Riccia fluitans]|uniref:Uncharacterized protein n=1 Tax=Riccia fluitans TaxID=41844 RepID=A0ABD1YVH6_9MARC
MSKWDTTSTRMLNQEELEQLLMELPPAIPARHILKRMVIWALLTLILAASALLEVLSAWPVKIEDGVVEKAIMQNWDCDVHDVLTI